jgi:hypothetical protein
MRKLFWLVIVAVLILLALPAVFGFWTERVLREYVASMNHPGSGMKITVESYKKGWLTSTATFKATLTKPEWLNALKGIPDFSDATEIAFVEKDIIYHGPYVFQSVSGASGYLGQAVVDTKVFLSPKTSKTIGANVSFLNAITKINYGGAMSIEGKMPLMSETLPDDAQIKFGGATLTMEYAPRKNNLNAHLIIEPITFEDTKKNESFEMQRIEVKLSGKDIKINWDKGFTTGKFVTTFSSRGYKGRMDKSKFSVTAVESKTVKDINHKTLSFDSSMRAKNLFFDQYQIGLIELLTYARNIDTQGMMSFLKKVKQKTSSGVDFTGVDQLQLLQSAGEPFTSKTQLGIRRFKLATPNGSLLLKGKLSFPQMQSNTQWMNFIKLKGNFMIDKSLVSYVLSQFPDNPVENKEENKKLVDQNTQALQMYMKKVNALASKSTINSATAGTLLSALKNRLDKKGFVNKVGELVKAKKLPMDEANNLVMLYSTAITPIEEINLPSPQEEAKTFIDGIIKKGFLNEEGGAYLADFEVSKGGAVSNGKKIF